KFQFTTSGHEYHRLLAALAHDVDAVPDGVYLQSVGALINPAPHGQGLPGVGRASGDRRRVRGAVDVPHAVDDVGVWNLAWRRLSVHPLGRAPRRVSRRQSWVATGWTKAVA